MFSQPHSRLFRQLTLMLFLSTLVLVMGTKVVVADEISIWNFNDSDLIVDHGTGVLATNFIATNVQFASGTTNNARLGDLAGLALSLQGGTSNSNNGRNITINVSTVGFTDIVFSFATQGTSTGFNLNQFQYSLDGVNFIDFGLPIVPATTFGTVPIVFSLSSIVELNNNPNATFRIVFNGATSSTGNNRIDNIVVEGTSSTTTIPEPTSALLLVTGISSLLGLLRKKQKAAR